MANNKTPVKKSIPGWMNFVIGGTSGMMSTCIVQPMDLIKTRLQLLGPGKQASTASVAGGIIRTEGLLGLYSGLSAGLFRQATYTTGRLGCFNLASDVYKNWAGEAPSFPIKLLMGMMAGGVGAFIGTPAEVCLIRMTADGRLPTEQRRNYRHVFNALARVQNAAKGTSQGQVLASIIKNEGVLALWSGFLPTLSKIGPHTVFTFIFMEQLNALYLKYS